MSNLVVSGNGSAISKVMATTEEIKRLTLMVLEAERSGLAAQKSAAEAVRPLLAASAAVEQSLDQSLRQATEQEIGAYLALLLKAYPNMGKDDASAFGRLLLEDVIDLKPSIGGIEAGCRAVRQTCKFLPAISEVLEAVRNADRSLRGSVERLRLLPGFVEKLDAQIQEGELALQRKADRKLSAV